MKIFQTHMDSQEEYNWNERLNQAHIQRRADKKGTHKDQVNEENLAKEHISHKRTRSGLQTFKLLEKAQDRKPPTKQANSESLTQIFNWANSKLLKQSPEFPGQAQTSRLRKVQTLKLDRLRTA